MMADDLRALSARQAAQLPTLTLSDIKSATSLAELFGVVLTDSPLRWSAIRRMYEVLDINEYLAYPVDWTRIFTPIESAAWGAIRDCGLPMWPQFPVGRFFADFADPHKKIIVECDGKLYHDKARDAARDAELSSLGWTVFRVSGADCKRLIPSPSEVEDSLNGEDVGGDAGKAQIVEWYESTADGLMASIRHVYYGNRFDRYPYIDDVARSVLAHRSGGRFGAAQIGG